MLFSWVVREVLFVDVLLVPDVEVPEGRAAAETAEAVPEGYKEWVVLPTGYAPVGYAAPEGYEGVPVL